MTRHILVTAPGLAPAGLRELGKCDVHFVKDFGDTDGLRASLASFPVEAVISRTMHLSEENLRLCPSLRVICKHGTGVSNIDMAGAERLGIAVFSTPGANARAVAEFTIGMMVSAIRRIPKFDRSVRKGEWVRSGNGAELSGRTLGLVGFGRISRQVARVARAMEMKVVAYDPLVPAAVMADEGVGHASTFDALLPQADVLSLHCPAVRGAPPILDSMALSRLPKGAVVINTARGELIDEEALADALADGRLAAAALDTFAEEPPRDGPLRRNADVVLTPHVGGSTLESLDRMAQQAARIVLDYLDALDAGRPLAPDLAALCLNPGALDRNAGRLVTG